ncbi:MAG: putative LuxR family transcriptional regulator [Anaerolineales bacterium]|nr:putative LuxR family transcriptional regulator [Anaerolineales bacterium]
MSERLTITLFGKPRVERAKRAITGFISAKAQALLFYLAATGRPHTREALAGLLWGGMPEAQAGKNLRNALSNLRSLVGDYLTITREEVAFKRDVDYWLDVEAFRSALAEIASRDWGALAHAVELYQGDFLEGFYIPEALAFEEWMLGQRSILRGLMVQALHTLVSQHLESEEYAPGIDYANRLLGLEPWREETHRHLMILLARSRQRSAALAQYETCRRVLVEELGVQPMQETTVLYERLKAAAAPPPHNLPPQPTPFVGREAELAEIARYLKNREAQLLTLVGPGGIGKTRLALQAAARCVGPEAAFDTDFADGVFFVPLAANTAAESGAPSTLIAALADALPFSFQGPVHPQAQLLNYLREKKMLLILDNFEHLAAEARQLGDILRLVPGIKLLVTSRVRLSLREEWALEVEGLAYPKAGDAVPPGDAAEGYSAIALFVQQARRMRLGFTLVPADIPHVVRICQLVEGVPLGIELAASWLRVLSCVEIAAEIEKGLDFLTSAFQNVSERHRSLRAVFEHSWNLLSPPEQILFRQLSVFRGGFQREAAAEVVGASLPVLAGLADKSLLRRTASGRYEVHELLRQYAEEKLRLIPEEHERVHDQHCRYYAELLSQHKTQLKGENSLAELTALSVERENVRAAWNRAVEHRKVAELNQFMDCL